jgi:adenine-specific DNA-methyltransferase
MPSPRPPFRRPGSSRPAYDRGPAAPRDSDTNAPRPPLTLQVTTLWDYPSQHYDRWVDRDGQVHTSKSARTRSDRTHTMQGSKDYVGATPSWVIWNLLMRYTAPGETVLDPMVGSGTTLDVCSDLDRKGLGFDLQPQRPEIKLNDSRKLPLQANAVDFVFIDPPFSTHVAYSDDPRCIGKLDAAGDDGGEAYYGSMQRVIGEMHRVLRPGRHAALYVSDSWRRTQRAGRDVFMPIGFNLFALLCDHFDPVDIVCVARKNQKLAMGNHRKAAEESNFFLRGFNYLFIMRKTPAEPAPAAASRRR